MLDFGRDLCTDPHFSIRREWLVTNGIGGYASGTVSGILTRRYHGLLLAALQPPVGRALLLAKLDEAATYDGTSFSLFADRWADGRISPRGYRHLERFHLDGSTPVWTFALSDAQLQKRVWMQHGANTTYVTYHHARGREPIDLTIQALVNHRDHHANTRAGDWLARVEPVAHGLEITVDEDAPPLYLLSDRATATPQHEWIAGLFLSVEHYRGLDPLDDHLHAGTFCVTLQPGESLTLVASTGADPDLDGAAAHAAHQARERTLLADAGPHLEPMTPAIGQLVLAADQFIVRRTLPGDAGGRSVIAGYPWFSDWGRDTMISLPGLALTTGRHDLAARILRTFAHYLDRGMLPNRFPDEGQAPEYNTVDATLWYFEAIRAYYEATQDLSLLRDLYPALQDIVDWHQGGTRYQIMVDPADGLLYSGQEGVQLTWMDAKVDDWVVTPRQGKAVEINALWHNALRTMAAFSRILADAARVGPQSNAGRPSPESSIARVGPQSNVGGPSPESSLARVGPQSNAGGPSPESSIARVGPQSNADRTSPGATPITSAPDLKRAAQTYDTLAARVATSFSRFWNPETGHCYDLIDGPNGHDPALRPNQLFAVSLTHSPLPEPQQRAVVDACARHLLTSHGLRSLAPEAPAYIGRYGGDRRTRDAAYHQGTVWGWLIGPFVRAHLRVYRDPATARSFLQPLLQQLASHGLGSLSEIFDGDPPFTPRGCIAQAWTVAEVLRTWQETSGSDDLD